jgi:hypothetical protein
MLASVEPNSTPPLWPFRAVGAADAARAREVLARFDVVVIFEHLHREDLHEWLGTEGRPY